MSVSNLKRELADLSYRGRAGCIAGVIVSDYMWKKLNDDYDGEFKGRIGVSGIQGNRNIRYEFYVLMSSTFPKERFHNGYFLVPFSEDHYRGRVLGHESNLVGRSETLFGWKFEELDPLQGSVEVSHPGLITFWIRNVDFEVLLNKIKAKSNSYHDVHVLVSDFSFRGLVFRKPDEVIWLKHPERYDYHRSDLKKAVGRLLMRHVGDTRFEIVGIALNGRKQIVEIVKRFDNVYKFAEQARWYFLPEEILDFLSQFGLAFDENGLYLDPQQESWGHQVDKEGIGRLEQYVSSSKGNGEWDLYSVKGSFIGSRDVEYTLDLCDRIKGREWARIKAEHFPPGWTGWPETSRDKSMRAFFANT